METYLHIENIREIIIFLAATAIVVPMFNRINVNPVLGYLVIGAFIGPYGLGLLAEELGFLSYFVIDDIEGVKALGEFGVIFMLFTIGLELSIERLWRMRHLFFGLGLFQVILTSVSIILISLYWGLSMPISIVMGCSLSLSSTAVVMKILIDRKQIVSPFGQASFAVLLVQDLAVVPLIFIVALLGEGTEQSLWVSILYACLKAIGAIVGILLLGRFVIRPLFRFVAHTHSPDLFLALTLLVVICSSMITGVSGLSLALGAFLAGLVLAETEFRNQIEVDMEPFKGLFMGLFFMSVGMGIDVLYVSSFWAWILASVIGLLLLKALILIGLSRMFGFACSLAVRIGFSLGQAGEFGFVILGLAMSQGVIPLETGNFVMVIISISILLTPAIYSLSEKASVIIKEKDATCERPLPSYVCELKDHIIVAGFGRVGQTVGTVLRNTHIPYVAIDFDGHDTDFPDLDDSSIVVYGDAMHSHLLEKIGIKDARAIVITLNDMEVVRKMVEMIKQHYPSIYVIARAKDYKVAEELKKMGADDVILETVEMSLQLSDRLLRKLEMPYDAIYNVIEDVRAHKYHLDE